MTCHIIAKKVSAQHDAHTAFDYSDENGNKTRTTPLTIVIVGDRAGMATT